MSEETPFYIASVAHGHVPARSPNGQPSGVIVQYRGDQDKPQKWIAERGDEKNIVALRNLSTKDYLHADGGTNWSTVGTGEKQWWKIQNDNVNAPGACSLSPVEYPGVFLNHFQGIRVAKGQSMKVHMWQWEQPNELCLTWYFKPADCSFLPQSSPDDAAASPIETNNAENDATAAKIEELEAKLARQKQELERRRAELKQSQAKSKEQKAQKKESLPPAPAKVTVQATNGVAKEAKKEGCKHMVLPPPRKIRRKVVGIVYKE